MFKKSLLSLAIAGMTTSFIGHVQASIELQQIGRFETGVFDDGAAEIVAYDKDNYQLFVINAADKTVDIIDISIPDSPEKLGEIDVSIDLPESGGVNSVAVARGLVAVAVENDDKQANGWVAFYNTEGVYLGNSDAGALPDGLAFSRNGRYLVVANEGEPNDDYSNDPEGSITIIDLKMGFTQRKVMQADFGTFNEQPLPVGMRAPRPFDVSLAQDLEPEFPAISRDNKTAYVTLQENNGLAVVDLKSGTVTELIGLGTQDHSKQGNGLDASNKDDAINIQRWPVRGMYMPDAIFGFYLDGKQYFATANEGDAREYIVELDAPEAGWSQETCELNAGFEFDDGDCLSLTYIDEVRVKDVELAPEAFKGLQKFGVSSVEELQDEANLGRIKMISTEGMNDSGQYEAIYTFGTRSFSIWDENGKLISDSLDSMEQATAMLPGCDGSDLDLCGFNSTNDENGSFDDRSDDKGPEPEGVVVGKYKGKAYAFVGLERVGGIMVFDISKPKKPKPIYYEPARDSSVDPVNDGDMTVSEAGDLGPEGLVFIRKEHSPIDHPLLVVGNEVSGTTTIYRVK